MGPTKLIRNERRKALAHFFNSMGVACFIAAGIVPLIAANVAKADERSLGYIHTLPAGALLALCFGSLAYMILGDLEGD